MSNRYGKGSAQVGDATREIAANSVFLFIWDDCTIRNRTENNKKAM